MQIGPFNIDIGIKKTSTDNYRELQRFMVMEKAGLLANPKIGPRVQLAEYKSWVSNAVGMISKSVSKVHFKYYKSDTDEEINSTFHGLNRFKKIMEKPNAFMSLKFIKAFMQVQWDLCGMCAAYKARNAFGEIVEIWPLNMNDYLRTVDQDGIPIEVCKKIIPEEVIHIFIIGGKYYTFKLNELIFLSHPHPKYFYVGASPVEQQAYIVDIQNYIEIYERDFFKNSARVDMVLQTQDELNQNKAEEIKARWQAKYQGQFHEVAVLDKGLTAVPMKYTNQDFQFLELSRWSRDMVLACYPVNAAKLGITDKVSRSNSVFIDIEYNTYTIQPRLVLWDHALTQIAKEFDPRVEVRHDNPIPRDRQIEVQEARTFLGGSSCYSLKEFRKTQNLNSQIDKPKDCGDFILVPTKLIPLHMLEDYWKAQIKSQSNPFGGGSPNSQTDPARHDGDKPHLNPDGSDNRDTLPTDGRSDGKNIERYYRKIWYEKLIEVYENKDQTVNFIYNLISTTIRTYLMCFNRIDLYKDEKWIEDVSLKIFDLLEKTVDREEDIENQFNSNPRIAKICNFSINSAINYSKFLIFDNNGLEKVWTINNNYCGHKGRLKEFKTKGKFKIGDTELDFPGQIFNLNCDCAIGIENKLLIQEN